MNWKFNGFFLSGEDAVLGWQRLEPFYIEALLQELEILYEAVRINQNICPSGNLNIFYLYAVILVISSVFLLAVCCIFAVNFTPDFFLVQESGLSLSLEHSLAVQAGLKRVLPLWSSCFS